MMALPDLSKIAMGLVLLLSVGSAIFFFGEGRFNAGMHEERAKWQAAADVADKEILRLNIELVARQLTAAETYAERLDAREPIIVHDRQTIREFAATPAGAVRCLEPDRVRDIERTAAQRGLGYSAGAREGESALHADAAEQER